MPLKTAKTKEEIPAQFQAGAVEAKDGTFAYEDDGGLKAKNTELINTNRELSDRIGSIERSLGGLKPEEITETVQKAKDAEEEALRKAGDIPAILERKLKPKDDEIAALKKLVEEKTAAHNDVVISNHIEETMTKIGVLPDERGTVRDLLRFRKNIRLDDKGKPVAYDDDGIPQTGPIDAFFGGAWKEGNKKRFEGSGSEGGGASAQGKPTAVAKGGKVTGWESFGANISGIAKGEVQFEG